MVLIFFQGSWSRDLEKELPDKKSEFYSELRLTRHRLVLAMAEVGSADQMQMVLTHARREKKILTEEEVHKLKSKLKSSQLGEPAAAD